MRQSPCPGSTSKLPENSPRRTAGLRGSLQSLMALSGTCPGSLQDSQTSTHLFPCQSHTVLCVSLWKKTLRPSEAQVVNSAGSRTEPTSKCPSGVPPASTTFPEELALCGFVYLGWLITFGWDRDLLCSSGWPQTHDPPASASWVLVWATMPGFQELCLTYLWIPQF
jgi:hypothetical protein